MARKPRVHYPGAYYHVMLRGNGGMQIFHDQSDRKKFLNLIQESVIRFEYRIHAFCLMTNHVHFVMQVSDIPLSKIIQNISFRYTRYFNKRSKRIGHLFQGRYKALIVDADSYLLQLVRYIHLNPLRANMVVNLLDYPWSSHLAYLGQSKIHWLTSQFVFDLLTYNKNQETTAYEQFMFDQLRSQKRLLSKIRLMIAKLVIYFKVANLTDIAIYFNRDVSTFSRGLNRPSMSDDSEFDAIRCHIESTIAQA